MRLFMKVSVGVILAALAVSPLVARFRKDPAARFDHFSRVLHLTDTQKQTARSIFKDARTQAQPIVTQLKQGHEPMTAAVKGNRSDAEIKDIADRQGALVGQLAFIRAKAMAQLYAQLTPEQKTRTEAIRDRIKSRFTSIR
jgi:Spy/CpxP family protein refolding chaperone